MKKIILIIFSISIMLLGKNSELKIIMSYSLSNEHFIGYEEYENLSCYSNISKFENDIWDNYMGLIKIRNGEKEKREKIIVYENFKVVYYKNFNLDNSNEILELKLTENEKKIFIEKYKQALLELKENYIRERLFLFDKISSFSIYKEVEMIELENYGYLTFTPEQYNKNKIYNNTDIENKTIYVNVESLIKYIKEEILNVKK